MLNVSWRRTEYVHLIVAVSVGFVLCIVYMRMYKDDYDIKIIILYAACKAVDRFVHDFGCCQSRTSVLYLFTWYVVVRPFVATL